MLAHLVSIAFSVILLPGSVPFKKLLYWANVCFVAHETNAGTNSEAFPALKGLCDEYVCRVGFGILEVRESETALHKLSGVTAQLRGNNVSRSANHIKLCFIGPRGAIRPSGVKCLRFRNRQTTQCSCIRQTSKLLCSAWINPATICDWAGRPLWGALSGSDEGPCWWSHGRGDRLSPNVDKRYRRAFAPRPFFCKAKSRPFRTCLLYGAKD